MEDCDRRAKNVFPCMPTLVGMRRMRLFLLYELKVTPTSNRRRTKRVCRLIKMSGCPTISARPRALGAEAPPPPPILRVNPLPPVRKLLPPRSGAAEVSVVGCWSAGPPL